MIVYKITNLINGKCYIGSTTKTLANRKYGHIRESKYRCKHVIHKALRKYGEDNFKWEILCKCLSIKEIQKKEAYFIKYYNTFKNGYNSTPGFDNTTLGYKFTAQQRKDVSERVRGKNNPNYGNKWSNKQKQIASIRQSNNHQHLTGKNNPSKRMEVRNKIRETKMGVNNINHKIWDITKPNGQRIILAGGLKKFLIKNGITYTMITPMLKGKKSSYKGWIIKKIKKYTFILAKSA
jgi:group I intron endonuclease